MLKSLDISGFKSIRKLELSFANFTIFFGPNAVGKSNVLDAIQTLSRLASQRTINDALSGPIRGRPIELFNFKSGGLQGLLAEKNARFCLEALIERGQKTRQPYKYRVGVEIEPKTGALSVYDEHLETLYRKTLEPKGAARIRTEAGQLTIPSGQGRPRTVPLPQNHTQLSDERYTGSQFHAIEQCRNELAEWEVYYFDPREAMRRSSSPKQVTTIGQNGEYLDAFLYRLKNEKKKDFVTLRRVLTTVIPSIESFDVQLDARQGTLDIMVKQAGVEYSARVMSEGTLRILALCAIALNPWGGALIAIEEPENGVQPQRIELIAKILMGLSSEKRQIIVTSHSPIFCAAAIGEARDANKELALFSIGVSNEGTIARKIELGAPLFENIEIDDFLKSSDDTAAFNALIMRGALDAV